MLLGGANQTGPSPYQNFNFYGNVNLVEEQEIRAQNIIYNSDKQCLN